MTVGTATREADSTVLPAAEEVTLPRMRLPVEEEANSSEREPSGVVPLTMASACVFPPEKETFPNESTLPVKVCGDPERRTIFPVIEPVEETDAERDADKSKADADALGMISPW